MAPPPTAVSAEVRRAEGAALRRAVGDRNGAEVARRAGVGPTGSMLGQQMSGHRPISLEHGLAYASVLEVPLASISPRLAREAERMLEALQGLASPAASAAERVTLPQALEVLGMALALDLPPDVRQDVGDALKKLADRRGAARDQTLVLSLLASGERKVSQPKVSNGS